MNNNQTCAHQGVAPINLQECIHMEDLVSMLGHPPNHQERRQINRLSKLYETYETKIFCNDCRRTKMLFETEKKAYNFMDFNNEEIEAEFLSPLSLPHC